MNVDLHTHSTASDGSLTPRQLVDAAAAAGVDVLALTDHDTLAGFDMLRDEALPLRLVSGIELSAAWTRRDIHIVGLNFDPDDAALRAVIEAQLEARARRAAQMARRLVRRGAPDLLAAARNAAGGRPPGRVHFAACLVEAGVVATPRQAFRRLLGDGKPAHVRGEWVTMPGAVATIRGAGGRAVLAHPLTYGLTATSLGALIQDFADAGGDAAEWSDTAQHPALASRLESLLVATGLNVSSGSDYHGAAQPWRRLGAVDPVPEELTPLYADWSRREFA